MGTDGDDSAYGRLRGAILSLELIPGERVTERGLESLLGASRTPIRAALMRLENDGLTQREGRGWRVTPIDLAEVRAVMEYREAVEVAAVRLAVERADDEELAALWALAGAHRGCDDEETGLRDFSDFHLALVRLSRNQFLADGMSGALTRLSRTRWLGVRTPESRSNARDEHLGIVAALKVRATDEAAALTVAHNRGTRDRLLACLSEERRRLRGRGLAIIESAAIAPRAPDDDNASRLGGPAHDAVPGPTRPHHARDEIYEEGEREDGSRAESGAPHCVGEVVPAQADDSDGHERRDRAGHEDERGAGHAGRGPPGRVMEQDAEDSGQGHGGRGVTAGERQLTKMRPVDEVLEHPVVQKRGRRDGGHREDHAIRPSGEQATDGYGNADRDERDGRPRQSEPGQDAPVTAE
ncbi:MAG: FCD domain-containing protein [Trebonia sp.]|jgi:DNA-binding GntR family transcriptional regulator